MNLLKNLLIVIILSGGAWWLYSSFKTSDHPTPPAEAPLPFVYEATTTTYRIAVDLPATGNEALDTAVRMHAEERISEFDAMYGPAAFSDEDLKILGFIDRNMRYELVMTGLPWRHDPIDGMIIQEYDFTGGAHGITSLAPFAYDDSGDLVSLSDLFIAGVDGGYYLEYIADSVQPRLKAQLEADQILNQEMLYAGTKRIEENYAVFSLDESSITFYFNQYQVAPYAAGILKATVPLSELSDILSPEYF